MYVYVESNVKSKVVKVDFSRKHLKVSIEGKTLIDKNFSDNINSDDSVWTLEDGEVQDYKGTLSL